MAIFVRLDAELLERAYRQGLFPMGDLETNEIGWYRPDPRAILPLEEAHFSKSLLKTLRQGEFESTIDRCFELVMRHCANRSEGNWITEELIEAYCELHRRGKAHSIEVWQESKLAGGLYGVSLGGAFFGESKFHLVRDASKVALYRLVETLKERGFDLLEVQFITPHLASFGAREISGDEYRERLDRALAKSTIEFVT